MQFLVNGQLYSSRLSSPGIVLALNALPLNKDRAEALTLRYVQSVLRNRFRGMRTGIYHKELMDCLEPLGGIGRATDADAQKYPGLIDAERKPTNWEWNDQVDIFGLLCESYLSKATYELLNSEPWYEEFEKQHIFNIQKQTTERVGRLLDILSRLMPRTVTYSLRHGEVSEDGWVNVYHSVKYPERECAGYQTFNFIEHQVEMHSSADGKLVMDSLQWLPKELIWMPLIPTATEPN